MNSDSVAHESFNRLTFGTVFLTVSDTLILPHREQGYWPEAFVSVSPCRCESLCVRLSGEGSGGGGRLDRSFEGVSGI